MSAIAEREGGMADGPRIEHVYRSMIVDSTRWQWFEPRAGDIVVCSAYKAGATWAQTICALLVHRTPDLPTPLSILSPWLDKRSRALDDVLAELEAQTHRRVIKTHTPLDAMPWFDAVTYLYCGRDPRDVFMSLQNHMANIDPDAVAAALAAQGVAFSPPRPLPDDLDARFEDWLSRGAFAWERDGAPYWSCMRHAQTFWRHRGLPNLSFLHYADLIADRAGEMRRLAAALGISLEARAWPALVEAAGFDAMKARADRLAPDADHGIWKQNAAFFNKGRSGQWRGVLGEASLRLYDDVVRARYDPTLIDWLERGSRAAGDPARS
jgi:aryl sulfotransferase